MIDPKDSLEDAAYAWLAAAADQIKRRLERLYEDGVTPNPLKADVGHMPSQSTASVWADDGELTVQIQIFTSKSGFPGWRGVASAHGRRFPFKGAGQRTDPMARFVEEVIDTAAVTIDDHVYGRG